MSPIPAGIALAAVALLAAAAYLAWPWLRDRFARIPIPEGWENPNAMAEIRPQWDEPLTGELLIRDPHLGDLPVIEKLPALLYDAVRDEHPVDLGWRPSWAEWAVA